MIPTRYFVRLPHMLCLTTLLSFVIFLVYAPAQSAAVPLLLSGANQDHNSIEFKHYCSNTLSEAIRLICGGRFYSLKKKFPESVGEEHAARKRFAPDLLQYPTATSISVHECCVRPCGYSELKAYCDPD